MKRRRSRDIHVADHVGIDEPLTINASTVADYLASQQRHGMEQWVRECGRRIDSLVAQVAELSARINEMCPASQPTPSYTRFTGD